jgi:hypothetical protein
MSSLAYTRDQLVAAAKSACAITATGTDFDTGNAAIDLVNDAVQFIANERDWGWTRRPLVLDFAAVAITSIVRTSNVLTITKTAHGLLAGDYLRITGSTSADGMYYVASVTSADVFTVNQAGSNESLATPGSYIKGFVALPADFLGLASLERNAQIRMARPVSMQRITQYRAAGGQWVVGPYGCYYNVRSTPQTVDTAAGAFRLELFPCPSEAETAALAGEYKRAIPTLANGSSIPDIGPGGPLHACLRTLCRAMAISTEEERAGEDWRRYERMLAQCAARDGDQQSNLGPIEGGVGEQGYDGSGGDDARLYPSHITA